MSYKAAFVDVGTLGARPSAATVGDNYFYFATDDNGGTLYRSNGATWTQIAPGVSGGGGGGAVSSVFGRTGAVLAVAGDYTASDVGAQPSDADLTALAALSTTSFGRSLLELANSAALLSAAGADASGAAAAAQAASQPLDSDLTAIAALSTTSFGRGLLALADAAALRATVGTLDLIPAAAADVSLASHKLTNVTDPGSAQDAATKNYVDAAVGVPIPGGTQLVYRYTVTGTDKASIDTGVDTPDAGTNVWTNGDVLEIWAYARTDETVALSSIAYTFNNDGSSIYDKEAESATNASVAAAPTLAASSLSRPVAGASAAANIFGVHKITIPNYAGTVGFKVGEMTGGVVDTTAANTQAATMVVGYRSASAISRLAVTPLTAGKKLKVGSQLLIFKRLAS